MQPVGPIDVLRLFPLERTALLELLESLHADDWGLPTVCDDWSVKDIAAHLLADDLGRLSRDRDGYTVSWIDAPTWDDLVAAINVQNEVWVAALRRLSPRVLIDLLRDSGERTQAHFESLDLDAIGPNVSWVSPDPVPAWLDLAREYTERWAHQQQIRDAVTRPGLFEPQLFAPVIDAYVRALPYTFRDVLAPDETHVRVRISGAAGGVWSLVRREGQWELFTGVESEPEASIALDQEEAWRLFTRGTTPEAARAWAFVEGDATLATKVLDTVSVIA